MPVFVSAPRPQPHDHLTGFREAARQEIALADLRYIAMLGTMLEPCAAPLPDNGLSVRQACDLIQASWYGIRHKARDRDHLLELLASLKAFVLRAAEVC